MPWTGYGEQLLMTNKCYSKYTNNIIVHLLDIRTYSLTYLTILSNYMGPTKCKIQNGVA